jgi:cyclic pyranopterin phosphate synthase
MTTNGITLFQNIQELHAAGLNGVNISLDTLDEHKFSQLTRRPSTYFHNVMKSIESAIHITHTIDPNFVVKINCVIMRHMNDNEIIDFIQLTERYPSVQIRFIEYMPFQSNGWKDDKFIPYQEIILHINQSSGRSSASTTTGSKMVHLVPVPSSDPHDTTKWYTNSYSNSDHNNNDNTSSSSTTTGSRIGFITSMSQHFCNSCNRLRLTADGQLKVCLFDGSSDDTTTTTSSSNSTTTNGIPSISLRDAIRNDITTNEIEKLIYLSVQKKHAILGGHTDPTHIMLDSNNNRPMTLIGG